MKKELAIGLLAMAVCSCGHHTYSPNGDHVETVGTTKVVIENDNNTQGNSIRVELPKRGGESALNYIPNATVFRMSGNYGNNVAVTLSPEGELIYFPAPTDITADSEPIELGDGWWLNMQGFGPNSVFTKYTFAEYASLPATPSVEQIKLNIIHGAKVTDFKELPVKITDINPENLEEIKQLVAQ